ncbi:MAG: hypothetical protein AAF944_11900 [Bacteroidota bacterium]
MRQIISIILLFTIGVSSSGFTLVKHFCGDSLEKVELNHEVKGCCSDSDQEEMPDDCCHNEADQALLDSFSPDVELQLSPVFTLLVSYFLTDYLSLQPVLEDNSYLLAAFHSPPITVPDVYLWVQSFLI